MAFNFNMMKGNAAAPKKSKKFTYGEVLADIFPRKKDTPSEALRKCVFLVAISAFSLCLFYINEYVVDNKENATLYESIADKYDTGERTQTPVDYTPKPEDPEWYLPLFELENGKRLHELNSDYVGFLQIDGTEIQYPVVQTTDNDYYLNHAFDGQSSRAGTLFLDYRVKFDVCGPDNFRIEKNSDNIVVYGHEMKDAQMFGSLKKYKDNYSWYSNHPIIQFDSLYKQYKYKIFAVCLTDSNFERGDVFNYFNTFEFANSDEFYEYVNGCKRRSYVVNDVDVEYGDQLLTLSTCNQMFEDARLIVVARLLRDGEDELEGTQNASHNNNILMPKIWYKYNAGKYDPENFTPYG
jgi:sortase B